MSVKVYWLFLASIVIGSGFTKLYAMLLIVVLNAVNLSSVNVGGYPTGSTTSNVINALAFLTEFGTYPRCLAIETALSRLTAESRNISFTSMFAIYAL